MYQEFAEALTDAAESNEIDVVLLWSSRGAFCGGTDIGDSTPAEPAAADGQALAHAAGAFLRTLALFPKPVVAAVGGPAVGVGAVILLHCDLVIAAPTAHFEFPLGLPGIAPEAGSRLVLAARVGLQRASEWLFFGERIDVQTAYSFGLVNTIVQRDQLASAALARAEALTRLPQVAVRETKRLMREPLRAAVDQAITCELEAISSAR
jgi:enoyl-CoA hydratase/carnithine racemase